jgi:hypothetical protein
MACAVSTRHKRRSGDASGAPDVARTADSPRAQRPSDVPRTADSAWAQRAPDVPRAGVAPYCYARCHTRCGRDARVDAVLL